MYTDECIYVYTLTLCIKMNVYMCIYIYKDWMHKNTLTKRNILSLQNSAKKLKGPSTHSKPWHLEEIT